MGKKSMNANSGGKQDPRVRIHNNKIVRPTMYMPLTQREKW